jgi:hypothetical protein
MAGSAPPVDDLRGGRVPKVRLGEVEHDPAGHVEDAVPHACACTIASWLVPGESMPGHTIASGCDATAPDILVKEGLPFQAR